MKFSFVFLGVFFLLSTYLFSEEAEEELAKVAIAEFVDDTGTKNYEYLKSSISDAMDLYMQKRFRYERVEPKLVNRILQRKMRETENFQEFTSEDLKDVANSVKADVIVFGYYRLDQESGEIVIYTKIYLAFAELIVDLAPMRSKVDSALFKNVEVLAARLVERMEDMSQEAPSEEESEGGKIVLTRESLAKSIPKVWPQSPYFEFLVAANAKNNLLFFVNNDMKRSFRILPLEASMEEVSIWKKKPLEALRYSGGAAYCFRGKLAFYNTSQSAIEKTNYSCENSVYFYENLGSVFVIDASKNGKTKILRYSFSGEILQEYEIPYESSSQVYTNRYYFGKNIIVQYIYENKKTRIFTYKGDLVGEFHYGYDYGLKIWPKDLVGTGSKNVITLYGKNYKETRKIELPMENTILGFDVDLKNSQAVVLTSYYIHLFDISGKTPRLIREEKLSYETFADMQDIHFTKINGVYKVDYKAGGVGFFQFSRSGYRLYHHVFENGIGIPADYEINSHKLYIKRIVAVGGFIELAKLYIDEEGFFVIAGKNKYEIFGKFDKLPYLKKADRYIRERKDKLVERPGLLGSLMYARP